MNYQPHVSKGKSVSLLAQVGKMGVKNKLISLRESGKSIKEDKLLRFRTWQFSLSSSRLLKIHWKYHPKSTEGSSWQSWVQYICLNPYTFNKSQQWMNTYTLNERIFSQESRIKQTNGTKFKNKQFSGDVPQWKSTCLEHTGHSVQSPVLQGKYVFLNSKRRFLPMKRKNTINKSNRNLSY